jgi:hypothetical protein
MTDLSVAQVGVVPAVPAVNVVLPQAPVAPEPGATVSPDVELPDLVAVRQARASEGQAATHVPLGPGSAFATLCQALTPPVLTAVPLCGNAYYDAVVQAVCAATGMIESTRHRFCDRDGDGVTDAVLLRRAGEQCWAQLSFVYSDKAATTPWLHSLQAVVAAGPANAAGDRDWSFARHCSAEHLTDSAYFTSPERGAEPIGFFYCPSFDLPHFKGTDNTPERYASAFARLINDTVLAAQNNGGILPGDLHPTAIARGSLSGTIPIYSAEGRKSLAERIAFLRDYLR